MMTLAKSTTAPAGALYAPTGVSPEEAFQVIGRLRREAQDEIDRLLAFLDATDGDPDLEPSLGFPEPAPWHLRPGDAGGDDDREADVVDQEDDDAFHDADSVMAPRLDQDGRRDQARGRTKAGRQAAGRAAHAR